MDQAPRTVPGGIIIVFEGIDGSGKSTQLELAKQVLEKAGWPVQSTRNLGGTPIGEALREVIKSPLERPKVTNLYISVAIQEGLIWAMAEARRKNEIILMDRGPISLAAYEIYGSGLDGTLGWPHVDGGMKRLRPELTIIYKTSVETALQRMKTEASKSDYFESQPPEYFERVAAGYEALAQRYPNTVVIDAEAAIETVHEATMKAIRRALSASEPS